MNKDQITLLAGFLGALKLFLASAFDIEIPQDTVDSVVNMIGFGAALYAGWKNTYVSKKAKAQKEALKEKGLL